jgi:hypothetical protein
VTGRVLQWWFNFRLTFKRAYRRSGVLALDFSGNPTYQELRFLYLFIREWNLQEPGPSWN